MTLCHQVDSKETQVKDLNYANKNLDGVLDYAGMIEALPEPVPFEMPVRLEEPTNSHDVESTFWIQINTREYTSEVL